MSGRNRCYNLQLQSYKKCIEMLVFACLHLSHLVVKNISLTVTSLVHNINSIIIGADVKFKRVQWKPEPAASQGLSTTLHLQSPLQLFLSKKKKHITNRRTQCLQPCMYHHLVCIRSLWHKAVVTVLQGCCLLISSFCVREPAAVPLTTIAQGKT